LGLITLGTMLVILLGSHFRETFKTNIEKTNLSILLDLNPVDVYACIFNFNFEKIMLNTCLYLLIKRKVGQFQIVDKKYKVKVR
jgi:hypothetical protein